MSLFVGQAADMAGDAVAAVAAVDAAAEAVVAAVVAAGGATNNSPGHLLLLRYFVTRQGFRIQRR